MNGRDVPLLKRKLAILPYVKVGSVVSPSDCVVLGDTAGWKFSSVIVSSSGSAIRNFKFSADTLRPPFLSPAAGVRLVPRYTFHLTHRYSSKANIAFLDAHVETLTFWDLTLLIEIVHRRWHYDNKAHLYRLVYRNADNWSPLRGIDEEIPDD